MQSILLPSALLPTSAPDDANARRWTDPGFVFSFTGEMALPTAEVHAALVSATTEPTPLAALLVALFAMTHTLAARRRALRAQGASR